MLVVGIFVHHCVLGSYMITSNAAGSPGDRGYSLLTGLVLPTIAMLQGFYNLLLESKAAALQPDQNRRWYNVLSRFKAYLLNAPEPHPTWQDAQILLFLGSHLGGYPATIARGDLDPGWFLLDAHIIPQTFFYILTIDVVACAFPFFRPFLTLISDGYGFVGAVLLVYSLVKKAFVGLRAYQQHLPHCNHVVAMHVSMSMS